MCLRRTLCTGKWLAKTDVTSLQQGLISTLCITWHGRGELVCVSCITWHWKKLKRHPFKTIGLSAREFIARADVHPTALSLCTLNAQSLKAHRKDICTDSVLPKVKLMSLKRGWRTANKWSFPASNQYRSLNATRCEREESLSTRMRRLHQHFNLPTASC